MSRRPARAGLFHGVWTDLEGRKLRRVYRSEYGDLYRLWRKHTDIRLGVMPFGMRGALTEGATLTSMGSALSSAGGPDGLRGESPPQGYLGPPAPSVSAYRHGNLHGDAA